MKRPLWLSSFSEAIAGLSGPGVDRAYYLIRHGSMRVGVYAPVAVDEQLPHVQDEIYIIAKGRADFVKAHKKVSVQSGDLLFVEADADHHFENMQDDFAAWVFFWGPEGGEATTPLQDGR